MKPQFGWMLSPRDVNPRTCRGGGGGSGCQPPLGFSVFFPQTIKHQHLKFSVDVRLSFALILRQV